VTVELTAVCTLSVLKIAEPYRTLRPDFYCFAPCIDIYLDEKKKGQAGAELHALHRYTWLHMAVGLQRMRQKGSLFGMIYHN